MAIDIEEFENAPEEALRSRSNPERVLEFLAANDDKAFKAVEIAEETGVDENSIGTVLKRLEDRDLVRHRGEYWAIGEPERLRSFERYRRATERLNDRYGTENRDEWRDHAPENRQRNADDG